MTSWQMGAVAAYVRLTRSRAFATPQGGRRVLARRKTRPDPPARLRRAFDVASREVGGHRVFTVTPRITPRITPPGTPSGPAPGRGSVVYLHGGAYTSEIVAQHWLLVGRLARGTGRTVHVPVYGLAPQHDALEALAFVRAVAAALPPGEPVHLVGDSAGGGLALVLAQHWPDAAPPLVGATLISPWLDLAMTNPGIDEVEPHDPWLSRPGLHVLAAAWAGGLAREDPRVSPVRGRLDGLPPLAVHVGTRDIALADCRLLRDRVAAASGPEQVRYDEVPGAIHVHPLLPVPEGRAAREAIVAGVRASLDGLHPSRG